MKKEVEKAIGMVAVGILAVIFVVCSFLPTHIGKLWTTFSMTEWSKRLFPNVVKTNSRQSFPARVFLQRRAHWSE